MNHAENHCFEKYPFRIITLTPVHIGSGNTYDALEYINSSNSFKVNGENKKLIKRINFDKFFISLKEEDRNKILANVSDDSKYVLQEDFPNIPKEFHRYNLINECPTEKFTSLISEHIKTGDELYIPGSSIKGAIKTALFYNILPYDDIEDIENFFTYNKYKDRNFINNFLYNTFIDKYFSSRYEKNNPYGKNMAQRSILRFLHIADSSTGKNPRLYETVTIMAESKFNQPDGMKFYKNRGSIAKSYLETINQKQGFDSELIIDYDKDILNELNFSDKQKEILDIDFIKESIYKFSKDLINYELDFLKSYKKNHSISELNQIVNDLTDFYKKISKNSYNNRNNPILRIGAGSGLMATSIAMKIKNYDEINGTDIFAEVRDSFAKRYNYEFPKSRKVISNSENLPLSWVKLKFKEET